MQTMDKVTVFTDGSASVKDRTGGWGFVARFAGKEVTRSGYCGGTTISMMEILAINRALHFLKPTDIAVSIYSDSKYAVNALTEWAAGWESMGWLTATGKPVAHRDLIESTLHLIKRHRTMRELSIEWIKGHAGVTDNEIADRLAGTARRARAGTWKPEDKKFLLLADELVIKTSKHQQDESSQETMQGLPVQPTHHFRRVRRVIS